MSSVENRGILGKVKYTHGVSNSATPCPVNARKILRVWPVYTCPFVGMNMMLM